MAIASTITVRASGDHYNGAPQFKLMVDGVQFGAITAVSAIHSKNQWQDFTFSGTLPGAPKRVEVVYLNDTWGGTASTDRNLWLDKITVDGVVLEAEAATQVVGSQTRTGTEKLASNGKFVFDVPTSSITLRVSGDHYNGAPQFKVLVDGVQVGGIQTVTANHKLNQWQDITLTGAFANPGKVEVVFLNDAYAGTATTDRNLWLDKITVNGKVYETETAATLVMDYTRTGSEWLNSNGKAVFNLTPTTPPPGNALPVAGADSAQTREDAPVTIAVLANDKDSDGGKLAVQAVQGAQNGTVKINADGTVTYTPKANYAGPDSFTYTLSDGQGGTATGTVSVGVGAVADAPALNAPASLSAATSNSGTTQVSLDLGAALTDLDGSESLTVQVSGLPQGATLSAGTVANGVWTLNADQLTGLKMVLPASLAGTYQLGVTATAREASNGDTSTVSKTIPLTATVGQTTPPPPPPPADGGSVPVPGDMGLAGTVKAAPVIKPDAANEIVGLRLENNTGSAQPSKILTFGQAFGKGDVPAGTTLQAVTADGRVIPLQMDVKATNDDGSVRHAILSVKAPDMAAGSKLDLMLTKGAPTTGTALTPSDILNRGYDVDVKLAVKNADGSSTTYTVDVASELSKAIAAGKVETWMKGPLASEYRITKDINGYLEATFDIRVQADGTFRTEVSMSNGKMYTPGLRDFTYNVDIYDHGKAIHSFSNLVHHRYQEWSREVWTGGESKVHLVRDVPYLMASGALPTFDLSTGAASNALNDQLARLAQSDTGPLGNALLRKNQGLQGGSDDRGIVPQWYVRYLVSQDERAETVMKSVASAASSIPWHFKDEATGTYVTLDKRPNLWIDNRDGSADKIAVPLTPNGWELAGSHHAAASYVPYLLSGSHRDLDNLHAETSWLLAATYNSPARQGGKGLLDVSSTQVRSRAWGIRDLTDAAWVTPDGHALKGYFNNRLDVNLQHIITKYIEGNLIKAGELTGYLPGAGDDLKGTPPWQQDFVIHALATAAERGYTKAEQIMKWMDNFVSGRFLAGDKGMTPLAGPSYWYTVKDAATQVPYTTWKQVYDATFGSNPPASDHGGPNDPGHYFAIARGAMANLITTTGSTNAMEALGYMVSKTGANLAQGFASMPGFNYMTRLPDGTWIDMSRMKAFGGSTATTMTGTAAGDLLHGGTAGDVIDGAGGSDMLFGGLGSDTVIGGQGNDFLFGGDGNDRMIGGVGNDWMKGGKGADAFVFDAAGSGKDKVADFELGVDRLEIKAGINGGVSNVADLVRTATLDAGGNAVLHLGGGNDVTLLGIDLNELQRVSITLT